MVAANMIFITTTFSKANPDSKIKINLNY